MKSAFLPRLVNHPFGDPALYVAFRYQGRAMLFDLGRIDRLPATDLLKVTHVFVSHTHMDHFIGFDHFLRVFLSRNLQVDLFGPPGLIDNVRGKLAGYTWNLVDGYPFVMKAHDVHPDRIDTVQFRAATAFRAEAEPSRSFDGLLHDAADCTVHTTHLNHRIPSLAFALQEKTRINVRPEKLGEMQVGAGPWLNQLKQAIRLNLPDDTPIRAEWREQNDVRAADFTLGALRESLVVESRGQKIAYVVDAIFSRDNLHRVSELARDADVLFCESLFLDADRDQASKRYHLTARQAATLARAAKAQRLETFHFSPRYEGDPTPLRAEAQAVFRGESPVDEPAL